MTTKQYNKKLLQARTITNLSIKQTDDRLFKVLTQAHKDISSILSKTKEGSITQSYYANKQRSIEKVINGLNSNIKNGVLGGVNSNINQVSKHYKNLSKAYIKGTGIKDVDINTLYNTVPRDTLEGSINRLWGNDNFSDNVWKTQTHCKSGVTGIIQSGIARGESAVNMSKRLQQFLVDPKIHPEVSWTTGVKKSVTGKGTIHYNALRLARTEINNSYREALVKGNAANPITKGIKWNLSKSHKDPDVCDLFSESDNYGWGNGVYPSAGTPIDHPNGFCYLTEVLRPPSEWKKPKEFPERKQLTKKQLLDKLPKIGRNGVPLTPGQINSAYKMFNNSMAMIETEFYKDVPKMLKTANKLLSPSQLSIKRTKGFAIAELIARGQLTDRQIKILIEREFGGTLNPQFIRNTRRDMELGKKVGQGFEAKKYPRVKKETVSLPAVGEQAQDLVAESKVEPKTTEREITKEMANEQFAKFKSAMYERSVEGAHGGNLSVEEQELYFNMVKYFERAPREVKYALGKLRKPIIEFAGEGNTSHFSPISFAVRLEHVEKQWVYNHEYGHSILEGFLQAHTKPGELYETAKTDRFMQLKKAMAKDKKLLVNSKGILTETGIKAVKILSRALDADEDLVDLMNDQDSRLFYADFLGAITNEEIGYGHGKAYYKQGEPGYLRIHEAFADYMVIKSKDIITEDLAFYQTFAPNLFREFENMFKNEMFDIRLPIED